MQAFLKALQVDMLCSSSGIYPILAPILDTLIQYWSKNLADAALWVLVSEEVPACLFTLDARSLRR
jgi:hypothetical protein